MMKSLLNKGKKIGSARAAKAKSQLKSALMEELPDRVTIEESAAGVAVTSTRLSQDLVENSGLRDVAFLMRGVR